MKSCISNIAWTKEYDEEMYAFLQASGVKCLEIAPTRIFPTEPYDRLEEAVQWSKKVREMYGLTISSMQSVWYGRTENLFASEKERETLLEYTKKAFAFAHAIGCRNLVFGCPKNRKIGESHSRESAYQIAETFFYKLSEIADENAQVLAIEPNPVLYGTDFLNTTHDTLDFLEHAECFAGKGLSGIGLNLDFGTIIENSEEIKWTTDATKVGRISHIHISEPGLEMIKERSAHRELLQNVLKQGYCHAVSVEMKSGNSIREVQRAVRYLQNILSEMENE